MKNKRFGKGKLNIFSIQTYFALTFRSISTTSEPEKQDPFLENLKMDSSSSQSESNSLEPYSALGNLDVNFLFMSFNYN